MKGYIVERTNKAEIKAEEQSQKAERCRENEWNEIQLNKTKQNKQRNKNTHTHKHTYKKPHQQTIREHNHHFIER